MTTPIATRASASKPCPVCGSGSKGCNITADGLHFCRGDARPGWKRLTREPDAAGFHHYRAEDDRRNLRGDDPGPNGQPDRKPAPNWPAEAARYAKALTPDLKTELARQLNLPTESLDAVTEIGWRTDDYFADCWTFPERDPLGTVVGLTRRYRDGSKKNIGNRGLTLPDRWRERPGPVFLVEGASDAIAMSHCGLSAIGRPSNSGGREQLADLLRDADIARPIIFVGENDRRPDGKWPGKEGAEEGARLVAGMLQRRILWAMPPADYKDARAWILDAAASAGESLDWLGIGASVKATLSSAAAAGSRFRFIDSEEFLAADHRPEWIVPNVLVRDQPGVIAGPSKGMKTSLLVDLAVSIATGTPFLGKWEVRKTMRAAIASGESGEYTLKETCLRVLAAKGLSGKDIAGRLKWEFTLPTFSDDASMVDFGDSLRALEVDVVFIDPVYLALGQIDARNLFEMGQALKKLSDRLLRHGITPILAHHANRLLPIGEPMELQHLSYSGLEQYTRQSILLNRRVAYRNNGTHDLWLRIGGSAGHGSLNSLHIDEGTTDENFEGRRWQVEVRPYSEVVTSRQAERDAAKREEKLRAIQHDQDEVMLAIEAELASGRLGATESRIRERTAFSRDRARSAINRLLEAGAIISDEWKQPGGKNAAQTVKGFRTPPPETESANLFAQ